MRLKFIGQFLIRLSLLAVLVTGLAVLVLQPSQAGAGASTWVVNSTETDSDAGGCQQPPTGDCTLPEAITALLPGDRIHFDIPLSDGGCDGGIKVCTIALAGTTELPAIDTSSVLIDGYTQPNSVKNTNAVSQGINSAPKIRIVRVLNGGIGLRINGSNVTVRGLIINNFGSGIRVSGNDNHIEGNYLGPNPGGTTATIGNGIGVQVSGSRNVIGGTAPEDRNLISGNLTRGAFVVVAVDALVQGNIVGADATGTAQLGNGAEGISIDDSSGIAIGGPEPGSRNLISGNFRGVHFHHADSTGNTVSGNYIGTDITGTLMLGNTDHGINVGGNEGDGWSSGNRIGGFSAGARNVISGNGGHGVRIESGGGSGSNRLLSNYIGTNAAGTSAIPNGGAGVSVSASSANHIGGEDPGEGNLISGNGGHGLEVVDGFENRIDGNLIGTNAGGVQAVPNESSGIKLVASSGNTVGGDDEGSRNLISGNNGPGIYIDEGQGNTIAGNWVGTSATGAVSLPNSGIGLIIADAPANVVGGLTAGHRNVISGNGTVGVRITGGAAGNNVVQGNYIGTNATGTDAIANGSEGMQLRGGASGNQIGGVTPGARNVISGNEGDGIEISGAPDNILEGNFIGTSASGNDPLGNGDDGVNIDAGPNNVIGGSEDGAGNVIAFSGEDGIGLNSFDSQVLGINILGNSIHSNGGLGIDLQPDGVNPNDEGDIDIGPNRRQNFPELTAAVSGSLTIQGSLHSTPSTEFRVEFFSSSVCDATGHGEGATLIGFIDPNPSTDESGDLSFSTGSNELMIPPGHAITATATNMSTGDTSEFSNCVQVEAEATPTPTPSPTSSAPTEAPAVTPSPTPTPTATPTPTPSATVTLTPTGAALLWGDGDCDGDISSRDNQALLRNVLQQLPLSQTEPCPNLGDTVNGRFWGDWDCDGEISSRDNQALLRQVLDQNPLSQTEPCPDIGTES